MACKERGHMPVIGVDGWVSRLQTGSCWLTTHSSEVFLAPSIYIFGADQT